MEIKYPPKFGLISVLIIVLVASSPNTSLAADLILKSQVGIFSQHEANHPYPVAYINPFAAGLTMPGSNPMNIQPQKNHLFSPTIIPRITGMVVPTVVCINLQNKLDTEIEGILSARIQSIVENTKTIDTDTYSRSSFFRPLINSQLILPAKSNHNYYYYIPIWINDYLAKSTPNNNTFFLRSVFTLKDGRVIARDTVELRTLNPQAVHCIVLDNLNLETGTPLKLPGVEAFKTQLSDTAILPPAEAKMIWHRLDHKVLAGGAPNLETIWCIALQQSTWDKLSVINRQVLRDYVSNGGLVFIVGQKSEGQPELNCGSIVYAQSTTEILQKLGNYHQLLLNCLYNSENPYNFWRLEPLPENKFFVYHLPTNPDLTAARRFYPADERFFTPSIIQSQNLYSIADNILHPLWAARRICRSQTNMTWIYGEDGHQIRNTQRDSSNPRPGNWLADWADYLSNKTQIRTNQQAQYLKLSFSVLFFAIILMFIPSKLYRIVLPVGLGVMAILINSPNKPLSTQDYFRVFLYVSSNLTHKSVDYQIAEIVTSKLESENTTRLNPTFVAQEIHWDLAPRAVSEQLYYNESAIPVEFRLITGKLNLSRLSEISTIFRIARIDTALQTKLIVSSTRVIDDALLIYQGRSYPLGRLVPERPVIVAVPENLPRRAFVPLYQLKTVNIRAALWDFDAIWLPIKGQVFNEQVSSFQSVFASSLANIQPPTNELPGLRNFYRAFGLTQWQAGVMPSEFDPNIPVIIWTMQDIPNWMRNINDRPNLNQNNIVFIGITQIAIPTRNISTPQDLLKSPEEVAEP